MLILKEKSINLTCKHQNTHYIWVPQFVPVPGLRCDMISCWFSYYYSGHCKKDCNLYGSNVHSETVSFERTEVFLCPIKAYLSNTPTNLCIVFLNFSFFCFILQCYAFVQYCYVNTVQYNAMHKFVGVFDSPPLLSVVPLSLGVLEGNCFISLLLEMLMPLR